VVATDTATLSLRKQTMLHIAEFQVTDNVSYWNGETFFKGKIDNLRLNPLTNSVEYIIKYKPHSGSKGFSKILAKPTEIKESKHFAGKK
jgi:hypothetical protein